MPDANADLSEFYKYSRPKKKPCLIGYALTKLSKEDKLGLETALDEDAGIITNSAIQQWLKNRDFDLSVPAVVSHRKGTCSCEQD